MGVAQGGGHRAIPLKTSHSASEGIVAMAAAPMLDPARLLHEQLESAWPDLLRSLLATFIDIP